MDLLLIGEDGSFLRMLSIGLKSQGFAVRTVNDVAPLRAALEDSTPDVIIFDHVEPMDLFALNPRECGYSGPLVLLIEEGIPEQVLERLRDLQVLKKPFLLESLFSQIELVTSAS